MPPMELRTVELPAMQWADVAFTREQMELEATEESRSVKALLLPDGDLIRRWVWVRVPLHRGVRRAPTVDDVDTDIWMDACRGSGSAFCDLTGRSIQINRFPLDEPRDLEHPYTIVVAPQHTKGADVHPINHGISRLVPELTIPWRGNVLVFRHSKSDKRYLINVEEKDWTAVEMIISAVFRKGIVNRRGRDSGILEAA
ncbi:hypothetical protein DFH06DRAFT_1331544 [Mycena polygramma]|nr:hypothetical protein DFH06DRAFT_1331544 [Mycena polygramma]